MHVDLSRYARMMWLGLLIGKLQDGFYGIVLVLGKEIDKFLTSMFYELKRENIRQQFLGDY